jgi:hypothetical protein
MAITTMKQTINTFNQRSSTNFSNQKINHEVRKSYEAPYISFLKGAMTTLTTNLITNSNLIALTNIKLILHHQKPNNWI